MSELPRFWDLDGAGEAERFGVDGDAASGAAGLEERVLGVLAGVPDPEIPALSVLDLGLVRHVRRRDDGRVEVGVSPTYSGCPATAMIKADVVRALGVAGLDAVAVEVLSPPWTSDWISDAGRRRLAECGIAPPPSRSVGCEGSSAARAAPACPRCGSARTTQLSEFGSTPCKALHRCADCLEPFESFKCI